MKPHVLVCGGAGYIGSHMCKRLARAGLVPVTFDNLATGHRSAVQWGPLEIGDLLHPADLSAVFARYPLQAVLHFAARSLVGESAREPALYLRNNVTGTLNLLDAMRSAGVGKLVFSSTAAVYGNPLYTPIDEAHPAQPINPYGLSKWLAEQQIRAYCEAYGLRAVCLRYFNAAGADADGETGEAHEPETHLIPNIIRAALTPSLGPVKLFGNDYPTADGTCVRDYIHVEDLAQAHLLALDYMNGQAGFHVFNLGTGQGNSVAEVLAQCQALCAGAPASETQPRRPGDPATLVASATLARETLGWTPRHGLDSILRSALRWHQGSATAAACPPTADR
ncbi:UDP-glucose 4-epimerase GalE [Comamonas badia]|uniref:UDP-glucose 4-epimerase GalE n=1 Tax=Comamonas badia TaxID=265291 RepID=UPI0004025836|nr:UDP-glucose 4-epimerase GalE [Comamonas badia]